MELPKWLITTYPDYSKEELTEIYKESVEIPYWKKVLKIYERVVELYEYAYESKQLSKEHPEIISELEKLNIELKSIEITVRERYTKEVYPMVWKAIVHSILYRISFTEEKLKNRKFFEWETPIGATKKRRSYWYRHPFTNNDIYTAVNISLDLIQSLIEDLLVWLGEWLRVDVGGVNIVRFWIEEDWDHKVYMECLVNYKFKQGRKDLKGDEGINRAIKLRAMTLLCLSGIVTKPKFYSRWEKAPEIPSGRRIVYGEDISLTKTKKIIKVMIDNEEVDVEVYRCTLDFYKYELVRKLPLEILVSNIGPAGYKYDCDMVPGKWI